VRDSGLLPKYTRVVAPEYRKFDPLMVSWLPLMVAVLIYGVGGGVGVVAASATAEIAIAINIVRRMAIGWI
jgi:hypothetical protein